MNRVRTYTTREEWANSLSHALGILLGIVGGYLLLNKSYLTGDIWAIAAVSVYLAGMLSSYVSSTWYHALPDGRRKQQFQKIDHAAIYWHIAGTYTPLILLTLRHEGAWGWSLLAFIWLAAIVGTIISLKDSSKHSNLKTACYVIMSCAIFVAFKPFLSALQATHKMPVLYWVIAGGVSYIIGAIFYSLAKVRYMHTVFHVFTLGGSICHIIAIYWAI